MRSSIKISYSLHQSFQDHMEGANPLHSKNFVCPPILVQSDELFSMMSLIWFCDSYYRRYSQKTAVPEQLSQTSTDFNEFFFIRKSIKFSTTGFLIFLKYAIYVEIQPQKGQKNHIYWNYAGSRLSKFPIFTKFLAFAQSCQTKKNQLKYTHPFRRYIQLMLYCHIISNEQCTPTVQNRLKWQQPHRVEDSRKPQAICFFRAPGPSLRRKINTFFKSSFHGFLMGINMVKSSEPQGGPLAKFSKFRKNLNYVFSQRRCP